MKTIHFPNCWVCGRAVSFGNSKIDENHLAAHESCYVAKIALERTIPTGHSRKVGTIPARHAAESTTLLRKSVQSGSGQGGPWNTRCRRLSDFWITSDPTSWLISRLRFRVAGATGSLFLELHRQVNERPSRDFNSWGFNSLGKLNESAMGVKQLELRWPLGFPL